MKHIIPPERWKHLSYLVKTRRQFNTLTRRAEASKSFLKQIFKWYFILWNCPHYTTAIYVNLFEFPEPSPVFSTSLHPSHYFLVRLSPPLSSAFFCVRPFLLPPRLSPNPHPSPPLPRESHPICVASESFARRVFWDSKGLEFYKASCAGKTPNLLSGLCVAIGVPPCTINMVTSWNSTGNKISPRGAMSPIRFARRPARQLALECFLFTDAIL